MTMRYLPLQAFILFFFIAYVFAGNHDASILSWTIEPDKLLQLGANYAPLTWYKQEWRLLTFPFLHSSIPHLVINMSALWFIWMRTSLIFSNSTQFFIFFFCSAVAGWFSSMFQTDMVQIGAGSGIFGMLGATIGWSLSRSYIKKEIRRNFAWYPAVLLTVLLSLGWFFPTINQYANMSSSITGLLLGSIVSSKSESESWMTKLLVLLGVTLVIAIGGWLFTKPNFSDLESVHRMRKVQEVMASIEERDRQIEDKMVKLWSEVPNESRAFAAWQTEWKQEVLTPLTNNYNQAKQLVVYRHESYYPLVSLLQRYTNARLEEANWLYNPPKAMNNVHVLQDLREKVLDLYSEIGRVHRILEPAND